MAGGDRFALDVAVAPGARLVVTTAAAEKVYRTLEPATAVDVKLAVGAGAALAWLPQETILFDRARLRRTIEVDLADDARLLLAEAIVFGRTGMGETVDEGALFDRWRVRRDGRLMHAEAVRLDGAIWRSWQSPRSPMAASRSATVLAVPGDDGLSPRCAGSGNIPWRGRHLGLERPCGRALVRGGWRGAAARSCRRACGDARRGAAAALAQLTAGR